MSLIQLAGGEERRDEGHACHSSPNGDASWETRPVSIFGSARVSVLARFCLLRPSSLSESDRALVDGRQARQ